jgi:peptide/nickel transport system substrate-binding protein
MNPQLKPTSSRALNTDRRGFIKGSTAAGIGIASSSIGWNQNALGRQDDQNILRVGMVASPVSLVLYHSPNWPTFQMIRHMFDPLISLDENEQFVPGLTDQLDVSDDGLVYTLHLRDDVLFHDGTSFNAEAVKYYLELQLEDSEMRGHAYLTNSAQVQEVNVVDEFTVEIKLGILDVFFTLFLAGWDARPISPTAHQEAGADFPLAPVGTGPFKFTEYVQDSHLKLERFDDYWQGAPILDGIELRIIPESSVHSIELEAGTIDISHGASIEELEYLRSIDLVVESRVSPSVAFVSLNVAKVPTSDLSVRSAIAHAVDRDLMIEQTLYGMAEKSRAGSPSVSPYYTEEIPFIEYDPEEAGRILDEGGWVMGSEGVREKDGEQLKLKMLSTDFETFSLYNSLIQEQLGQIGIQCDIEQLEWGAYLDKWRAEGDFNITYMSFGASFFGDWLPPAMRSDDYWASHHVVESTDPELLDASARLDAIIDDVRSTQDPDERREKWVEGAQLIRDHQLAVWLWHSEVFTVCQPYIKDYAYIYNGYELQKAYLDR